MPPSVRNNRARWRAPVLLGLAGLTLLWTMWLSGGDFWPMQRPFMAVTLVSAAMLVATLVIAAALPRSGLRLGFILLAIPAIAATFLGEGIAERLRFDALRSSLATEVETIAQGGACTTRCRIASREPLRIGFLFNGEGEHWSGACYDAADTIRGVEYGGRVRPLDASEAALLADASTLFDGQVRHAPVWAPHWYGCSTRP